MLASRAVWGFAAGVVLTATVWLLTPAHAPPEPSPSDSGQLEDLRAQLDAALDHNRELSTEVEWLNAQLDLVTGRGEAQPAAPEPDEAAAQEAEEAAAEERPAAGTGEAAVVFGEGEETADGASPKLWFDEEALAAGGLLPHEIERLRDIFNASEMNLIELEHQARREGWYGKPRYWRALQEMRSGLRQEIGEEDFDLLLYATGRKNRVVVDDVLRNSPGDRAGLEPGDVVLSYEGRRIFKAPELKRATVQGRRGDRVVIDVLRDGEVVRVYATRGPLGAKLRSTRMLPEVR
jgi:hypothetical protein